MIQEKNIEKEKKSNQEFNKIKNIAIQRNDNYFFDPKENNAITASSQSSSLSSSSSSSSLCSITTSTSTASSDNSFNNSFISVDSYKSDTECYSDYCVEEDKNNKPLYKDSSTNYDSFIESFST